MLKAREAVRTYWPDLVNDPDSAQHELDAMLEKAELSDRERFIIRAALDVFSDLVEGSTVNVEGVGEMAGGDAAEIVRLMGRFTPTAEVLA